MGNDNNQLEITFSKALYLDDEALIEPDYSLYRVDGGDIRWYYCPDDGRYYPSVTSVIGATRPTPYGLMKWIKSNGENADAMRDERAAYGTTLHQLIEHILLEPGGLTTAVLEAHINENAHPASDKSQWWKDLRKDVLAFVAFAQDVDLKPIAVEIMLRGSAGYAGAADIVGYVNGALSIVDVKSGRHGFYDSHEIQLHMYKAAWEELYPDLPIERVYNWSPKAWRKKPTYTLKDQTNSKYAALIPHLLDIFEIDGHKPPTYLEFADTFSRDGDVSTMYKFTEIKDKIDQGG